MFYSEDKTEDLVWNVASQTALRDCSEEGKEDPGYTGVFAAKAKQSELQKITVN